MSGDAAVSHLFGIGRRPLQDGVQRGPRPATGDAPPPGRRRSRRPGRSRRSRAPRAIPCASVRARARNGCGCGGGGGTTADAGGDADHADVQGDPRRQQHDPRHARVRTRLGDRTCAAVGRPVRPRAARRVPSPRAHPPRRRGRRLRSDANGVPVRSRGEDRATRGRQGVRALSSCSRDAAATRTPPDRYGAAGSSRRRRTPPPRPGRREPRCRPADQWTDDGQPSIPPPLRSRCAARAPKLTTVRRSGTPPAP